MPNAVTRHVYRIEVEHADHSARYVEHRVSGWRAVRLLAQINREFPNARSISVDRCESNESVYWIAATVPSADQTAAVPHVAQ